MIAEQTIVRELVRNAYTLQNARIRISNRIVGAFKTKLGFTGEDAKDAKEVLEAITCSYSVISAAALATVKEPIYNQYDQVLKCKKLVYDNIITNYSEVALVAQYLSLVDEEERQFSAIGKSVKDIPIYRDFLKDIKGLGVQLSAVLISEFDIHKAEYPSSLWAYAGLDTVTIGYYKSNDKEYRLSSKEMEGLDPTVGMMRLNGYNIEFRGEGRSMREQSLVDREYKAADGTIKTKRSITYNPFLKAKLLGVLAPCFLKQARVMIDGAYVSAVDRRKLAKQEGLANSAATSEEVDQYLINLGMNLTYTNEGYAKHFYDYRNRLNNSPKHASKTPIHKYRMACRFMVKRFLVDLYSNWRKMEGLPVATEYSEGVLGKVHKKAG